MALTLSDGFAWAVGGLAVLSLVACFALRDLLAGSVPEDRMRGLLPGQVLWETRGNLTARGEHALEAQRSQWLALAFNTITLALYCRPVAWWLETWTAPGAAWVGNLVGASLAALFALDGLIYSLAGDRAHRLVRMNHLFAVVCLVLIVAPWFVQPPQPRGPALDEFVNYYQPTWASFISTLGMAVYLPVTCLGLAVFAWRAARREYDRAVRISLRLVAIGASATMSIVGSQLALSLSWTLGTPLWSENEAALLQLSCVFFSSMFLVVGCAWAPLTFSHRVRVSRFLMRLWEDDVHTLRPMWRLLGNVHRTAYEPVGDLQTALTPADLQEQRHRLAMELLDHGPMLAQYLSATGREKAERLTGRGATTSRRHRALRALAPRLYPLLRLVGGFAPIRAISLWRWLSETPLASQAAVDAACARAAVKIVLAKAGPAEEATPVLTPVLWSEDEVVGYLRQLIRANGTPTVQAAATGAQVVMLAERT